MWPCPELGCSAWFTVVPLDPHSPVCPTAGSQHQHSSSTLPRTMAPPAMHTHPLSPPAGLGIRIHVKTRCHGDCRALPGAGQPPTLRYGDTRLKSSWSATAALGLSQMPQTIRSGDSMASVQGCWELPFTEDIEPLGHGRRSQHWQDAHGWQPPPGTMGRGPQAHPSLLGTQVRLKGHLSNPGACPLPSPCPRTKASGEGPGQAALGLSWLHFAWRIESLAEPAYPFPGRTRPCLGKLYIPRDKQLAFAF